MISDLIVYLMVGGFTSLIMDVIGIVINSEERFSNGERIVMILIWSIIWIVFIYGYIDNHLKK